MMTGTPFTAHPVKTVTGLDIVTLLFGKLRKVFGSGFPIDKSIVPGLQNTLVTRFDFSQEGHDPFLQDGPPRVQGGRELRQLLVHAIVGQEDAGRHLVGAAANVGLLAEQGEAGHADQDGFGVDAPEVHEQDHLQLDMGLPTDGNLRAHVGVVTVFFQELIATLENLAQPLHDARVVDDQVLDQFLRH